MTSADGRAENTALEARPDVLTYTTAPLAVDTEIVGEVSADIWFSSSLPSADVFARLCDVGTQGRSWNVCDGLTRLTSANELTKATQVPTRIDPGATSARPAWITNCPAGLEGTLRWHA